MLKIGELMCCEVTDKKEQLFDFLSVNCVKNSSTKKQINTRNFNTLKFLTLQITSLRDPVLWNWRTIVAPFSVHDAYFTG